MKNVNRIIIRKIKYQDWYRYEMECNHCHKKFLVGGYDFSHGVGKFCSHSCSSSFRNKNKLINYSNKGYRWKGGGGYWMVYAPNHPHCNKNGYIQEHRLVVEAYIGRLIDTKHEVVHHIDHDKNNNDIRNLLLTTKVNHGRIHNPVRNKPKKIDDSWYKKCSKCDQLLLLEEFYIKRRNPTRYYSWCKKCHYKLTSANRKNKKRKGFVALTSLSSSTT